MQEDPYVMLKKADYDLAGNDRYEGFCVDLIKEIAERLNFQYSFEIVTTYGSYERNGWTGIVRELIDRVTIIFL